MKTKAYRGKKGRRVFDIFITSPFGSARHIESVEGLTVARQHLKQLGRTATGDCFFYSKEGGMVPAKDASSNAFSSLEEDWRAKAARPKEKSVAIQCFPKISG